MLCHPFVHVIEHPVVAGNVYPAYGSGIIQRFIAFNRIAGINCYAVVSKPFVEKPQQLIFADLFVIYNVIKTALRLLFLKESGYGLCQLDSGDSGPVYPGEAIHHIVLHKPVKKAYSAFSYLRSHQGGAERKEIVSGDLTERFADTVGRDRVFFGAFGIEAVLIAPEDTVRAYMDKLSVRVFYQKSEIIC